MIKKFLSPALGVLVFCALNAACSTDKPLSTEKINEFNKGKELASVNDVSIKEGQLDFLARINPRVKSQINNPASRQKIIDSLIEQELLYQASVKRGLDKNDDVAGKLALYQKMLIGQTLLEDEISKKTKEYYEKNKDTQFTKVSFSQIEIAFAPPQADLLNLKKDAKPKQEQAPATPEQKAEALKAIQAIKEKINAGEDFGKLAEALSHDKNSKKKMGEMGMVSRDDKRMARLGLDALTQAAFSLKKDQVSEPIESQRGYHLIKITSDPVQTSFEEAEKAIKFQIQQGAKQELIEELKKTSKVVLATPSQPATTSDKTNGKKPQDSHEGHDHGDHGHEGHSHDHEAPADKMKKEEAPAAKGLTTPPPMALPAGETKTTDK